MHVAIIGAGIVGLNLAREIQQSFADTYIDIYDQLSIPSSGTSIRNSGVLHAGLYYKPGSLKSELCRDGSSLLKEYLKAKRLPLLDCGKILLPLCNDDYNNPEK